MGDFTATFFANLLAGKNLFQEIGIWQNKNCNFIREVGYFTRIKIRFFMADIRGNKTCINFVLCPIQRLSMPQLRFAEVYP